MLYWYCLLTFFYIDVFDNNCPLIINLKFYNDILISLYHNSVVFLQITSGSENEFKPTQKPPKDNQETLLWVNATLLEFDYVIYSYFYLFHARKKCWWFQNKPDR